MNTKEMTAHLRNRIKAAGIKAKVRFMGNEIQVNKPAYDVEFTVEQQRAIRHIAMCNNLTLVRGMAIVLDQDTDPHGFGFFLP
jgi:hypothetical protein